MTQDKVRSLIQKLPLSSYSTTDHHDTVTDKQKIQVLTSHVGATGRIGCVDIASVIITVS
jgi:hypothetical protein